VIVESIFSLPGVGRLLVQAIRHRGVLRGAMLGGGDRGRRRADELAVDVAIGLSIRGSGMTELPLARAQGVPVRRARLAGLPGTARSSGSAATRKDGGAVVLIVLIFVASSRR
jgi:hypothetical protein